MEQSIINTEIVTKNITAKKESAKYLIVNRGRSQQGKTTSMWFVYQELSRKFSTTPDSSIEKRKDFTKVISAEINIGLNSAGDDIKSVKKIIKLLDNCRVIIASCRTKGDSFEEIKKIAKDNSCEIIWVKNPYNRRLKDNVNTSYAKMIAEIVDNISKRGAL